MVLLKRIVIIGGGAAGLSLLAQLIENASSNKKKAQLEILLCEKNKRIGPGLAYGTTSNANLLNTPAQMMGIYASCPRHFLHWLEENPLKWKSKFPSLVVTKNSTPPRRLYGIYLEEMSITLLHEAQKHGVHLSYIRDEIVDIDAKKMVLYSIEGREIQADIAILAIGALPSISCPHLQGIEGFFSSAYPEERLLQTIPYDKDFTILGTRLSAIDTILTFKNSGHKGKIFCISRSGALPCVQGRWVEYERKFLTQENLSCLTKYGQKHLKFNKLLFLIRKEIEEAENMSFRWKDFNEKPPTSMESFLLREITAATKERKWQSALYYTNDLLNPIWQMLSTEDKYEVLQKHLGTFLTFRAAFPLQNAKKLYKLIKKNELEVLGGVRSIQYDGSKKTFSAKFDNRVVETPYFVDATGVSMDIEQTTNSLIKRLKTRGLIEAHPFGGIRVEPHTLNIIDTSRHTHPNIFVLGGLVRGTHLIVNLLEYIAKSAQKMSKIILELINDET